MMTHVVGGNKIRLDGLKVSIQQVRCYSPGGQPPKTVSYYVNNDWRKLHLWGSTCGNETLLDPFFFERNVNACTYLQMLEKRALTQLAEEQSRRFLVFSCCLIVNWKQIDTILAKIYETNFSDSLK